MSANRSVQAAQRRRAGPTNGEPAIPGRSPQPSINSAQMFANQARPGSGPNMPTGRLAGQQAAMQQQQQQQQQIQSQQNKLSSVTKMTIPQAITLITLRLGVLESKLTNSGHSENMSFNGESGIDPGFLQSIMARLEDLEKRPASSSSSIPELNLLKQQMEPIKQAVVQSKNSTIALVKENSALKTQVENMRKELHETKELVTALQNLTMNNSQKILELSMGTTIEYNDESSMIPFTLEDGIKSGNFTDLHGDSEQNEVVGTDLKQLIENELNTGM
jgi:archaellum component FlaC